MSRAHLQLLSGLLEGAGTGLDGEPRVMEQRGRGPGALPAPAELRAAASGRTPSALAPQALMGPQPVPRLWVSGRKWRRSL